MFMITIAESPDKLSPTYELFTDMNGNGHYDEGEMFTDFNGDGVWTDVVTTTERTANWDLTHQISDVSIMVGGLNSVDFITTGEGPIFNILYMVDNDAEAGNVNMILSSVILADIFGNYNVQYTGVNGVFIISLLSTGSESIIPEKFSMSANYPNPFNPVTSSALV